MDDIFAKSLAPALGYPEEEVSKWLDAVFQRIAEDLVLHGEVHLGGLGVLRREHISSEPREIDGKLTLVPPRHEVKYVRSSAAESSVVFDVGLELLGLDEEVAQKFSRGFGRVVEKVVEVRGSLQMGELGEFVRTERDELMFKQSSTLSELLNKPFVGLSPVTISGRREQTPDVQPSLAPEVIKPDSETQQVAAVETISSEVETSFLKSPASTADEAAPLNTHINPLFEEVDESTSPSTSVPPREREPLFVALAAAARVSRESKDERPSARKGSEIPAEENGKPFEYVAESPARASYKPKFDDISSTSASSATENLTTVMGVTESDKEAPVLRNIAIATAIVFFTIVIAFIVMKYESISFTPPPPTPVDRAKIEAEKAAAARAEAERILAEKSIPKKAAGAEGSTIKTEGRLLKNITKAAKDLPKELTTIDLSKGGYTIIVASQPTRENAVAIVEEFGKLGFAATVMEKKVGNAIRYRVRVGQFATFAAANAAKKKYRNIIPADAFLDKVSVPTQ